MKCLTSPTAQTSAIAAVLILLLSGLSYQPVLAQSCSCGGPPLLGSLESSGLGAGRLGFSMRYEFASISDLVDGSDILPDNIRDRSVKTGLFGIDFGLTDRFSVSAFFSFVQQNRTTSSGDGGGGQLITSGPGDAIMVVQYALWPLSVHRPHAFTLGLGIKLPLGQDNLLDNSLLISADMQPGTGSYDYVALGTWSYSLSRQKRLALFGTTSYRINGQNDRFGMGNGQYQFGNELNATAGLSHDLSLRFTPSVSLKYRSSQADQFKGSELPSSGGRWLNLVPALNATIFNGFSTRVSGEFPLWRKLEGTQFSTSHTFSLTLFYSLDLREDQYQI